MDDVELLVKTRLQTKEAEDKLKQFTTAREIVTNVRIDGMKAIKKVKQEIDGLGDKLNKVSYYDMTGKMLKGSEHITKVTDSLKPLLSYTDQVRTADGKLITTLDQMDSKMNIIRTTTTKYVDEQNRLVVETEKFKESADGTWQKMQDCPITEIGAQFKNVTVEVEKNRETIERDGQQFEALTNTITTYENGIPAIIDKTTQWTNAEGSLVTETQKLDGTLKPLGDTITKVEKQLEKTYGTVTKTSNTVKGSVQVGKESFEGVTKVLEEVDAQGNKVITTTKQYKDAQGALVTETTKFDGAGNQLADTLRTVEKETDNTVKKARTMGQTFGDIIKKVTKFYLASMPIRMVQTALQETVQTVKDYDSAITEMAKVTDMSGDTLNRYALELGEIGKGVARTRTEMVSSATELMKAGYSEEDVKYLSRLVALYQNTADEQLEASEATSVLVSQMKAFGYTTEEQATHIIDSINEVSANFAVSSGDIGRGLTQAGASLSTYGNSFDQTVGLVTAGTEIFQGKSQQVARGLNTVASRVAKNEQALKEFGIEIYDQEGNLRSTYDILYDLSDVWDKMGSAEKVALGTTLAGVNQYKVFSAVMNNFDKAVEATTASLDSMGATEEQNAVHMDSIQAKTTALRAEFEKLVLGDGGLQNLYKLLLDFGIALLKVVNNSFVKFTAVVIATTGAIFGLYKALEKVKNMAKLNAIIQAMTSGTISLTAGVKALTFAWLSSPLGQIAIGVTVVYALIKAVKYFNETVGSTAKEVKKLKDLSDSIDNTTNEIDNLTQNLNSVREQIEKIQSKGTIDPVDEDAINKLKLEEALLEHQIELAKVKQDQDKQKGQNEAMEAYHKGVFFGQGGYGETAEVVQYYTEEIEKVNAKIQEQIKLKEQLLSKAQGYDEESEEFKKIGDEIKKVNEDLAKSKDQRTGLINKSLEYADSLQTINERLDTQTEEFATSTETIKAYLEAIGQKSEETGKKGAEAFEWTDEAIQKVKDDFDSYGVSLEDNQEAIENFMSENDIEDYWEGASAWLVDYVEQMGLAKKTTQDYVEAFDEAVDRVGALDGEFSSLSSAIAEYNSNGQFSISTIDSLLSLGTEYLSLLEFENGQLVLNEQGLINLANARIDDAEAKAYDKAMAELDAVAQQELENATKSANSAVEGTKASNDIAITSVQEAINKCLEGEVAWNRYWYSVSKGTYTGNSSQAIKQINDIGNALQNSLTSLENMRKSIGGYAKQVATGTYQTQQNTGATRANTSAKNDNADATNAQKEALEAYIETLEKEKDALDDEKSQYETAIQYIIDLLDEYIDELEAQKDAEVDAIEAKIDALEKERDAIVEAREETLDSMKEELDATLEIRDKELEALEAELEALEDGKDQELDALEERRDAMEEYYNDQINAIEETNDALDEQLELQKKIEAVANAKSKKVKVYRDGQFVYETDASAVAEAQQDLYEYQEELKRKQNIKELENERDSILAILDSEIDANKASTAEIKATYEERITVYKNTTSSIKESSQAEIDAYKATTEALKKNYDAQIAILEAQQEAVEDNYGSQIAEIEAYKKTFEDAVNAYERNLKRLTTQNLTGLDLTGTLAQNVEALKNFIDNRAGIGLTQFVDRYNALLGRMNAIDVDISSAKAKLADLNNLMVATQAQAEQTRASLANVNNVSATDTSSFQFTRIGQQEVYDEESGELEGIYDIFKEVTTGRTYSSRNLISAGLGSKATEGVRNGSFTLTQSEFEALMSARTRQKGYATGISSIPSDQIAVVGEDPNKELVIGSQINNGISMSLSKGTGVVNAKSTNTLAGILNHLGNYSASNFGSGTGVLNSNTNSNTQNFVIENVTIDGANITDMESFKASLRAMTSEAIQRAYRR